MAQMTVEEIDAIEYPPYAAKEATATQTHFADWIIDRCEITFATKKEEAAFRNGVKLAKVLAFHFQGSKENKEARASRSAERAEAKATEVETDEVETEAPAPKKAPAKRAAKAAPAATAKAAPAAPKAPRAPRKTAAKAAPAAPKQRPSKPRPAATEEEAPF